MDNTTVMMCINRVGGTRCHSLKQRAGETTLWCLGRDARLHAASVLADGVTVICLDKFMVWSLSWRVTELLFVLWGA